jgi:hypothetical protein
VAVFSALSGGNYLLGDARQASAARRATALAPELLALSRDGVAARPRDLMSALDPKLFPSPLFMGNTDTEVPHVWRKSTPDGAHGALGVFAWAALAAGCAGIGAHYLVFWAVIVFGLMTLWALFCTLNTLDMGWRLRAGFTIALFFGAILSIYPTYHDERYGKIVDDVPSDERSALEEKAIRGDLGWSRYLLSNIPFRLVRGLDLKGGLRLVYTVDVDEAIKDKRDNYYDELRAALTRKFGFVQGDDKERAPTIAEMQRLSEKLRVEKPREAASTIRVIFNDAADASNLDDALLTRFSGEMSVQRSADRKEAGVVPRGGSDPILEEQVKDWVHVPLLEGCRVALDLFEGRTDFRWSFLSPPWMFRPGPGTGSYELGVDYMIFDEGIPAGIDLPDLVLAVCDETENQVLVHKHWTCAGRQAKYAEDL